MKRIVIGVAAALLVTGFLVWWFSPERVVKRRTLDLLETLTLESGANKTLRQLRAYGLTRLLAEEVVLDTPEIKEANGTFERGELESAFSYLCNQARQTMFEVEDFGDVSVDGDEALVDLVLEGLVELPTSRPADGRYDVVFFWRRAEDGWRLRRAEWSEK